MHSFVLAGYRWERTSLYLEFADDSPLVSTDSLVLKGSRYDPMLDVPPVDAHFKMSGCYHEGPSTIRVRFMLGEKGNPVRPGLYQLLVKRGGDEIPVQASSREIHPRPTSDKRDDVLLNAKTSSYYKVVPQSKDGALWFLITARGFPNKFGYQPQKALADARAKHIRGIINDASVKAYRFFRRFGKKDAKKILFTSDSRTELSGNMEPLYHRMCERGLDKEYDIAFSFTANPNGSRSVGEYLSLARHLATSKVIFCDDFQPYLYHLNYPKGTRLVQLWHACGHFKTVGGGRIGTLDAVAPFTNDHRNYTDVIVASESDVPIYGEAFNIPDENIKPYGIPRHDWLLDPSWQEEKRKRFAEVFPQAAGKKVIVFAPTFRGPGKTTAYYDYNYIDFRALLEFCRREGFFFIFKMHPFVTEKPPIADGSSDVFANGSGIREINDLLPSTDVLVTDYSSVVYEAALLNIPTVYFAYDLEDYISDRDFYEPYEEFVSGPIVRDVEGLFDAIRNVGDSADRLAAFRMKNFKYLDGGACDRIIDNIVLPSFKG